MLRAIQNTEIQGLLKIPTLAHEEQRAICCPIDTNIDCRKCRRSQKQLNTLRNGIHRAADLMSSAIAESLTIQRLAATAGMSHHHFAREFKRATGMPPVRYLLLMRINLARCLLRDHRNALAQITIDCGFASQSNFTTAFKRETGITPMQYRRATTTSPAK